MSKWKRGLGLVTLALAALLVILSASMRLPVTQVIAQDPPELQVDVQVQINKMPNEAFLPLVQKAYMPDWPRTLSIPTGSDAFARASSWVRYTVTYSNPGPGTSAPVEVTLELPEDLDFCAECNPEWTSLGGNLYGTSGDPLNPGEWGVVKLAAQVPEYIELPEEPVPGKAPMTDDWSSQVTVSSGTDVVTTQAFTAAATYLLGPSGHNPVGLAVDPDRNLIYIGIASTGQLVILNPSTQTVNIIWHPAMGSQAAGVAYMNDKIYIAYPDASMIGVIDANTRIWLDGPGYPILMPFGAQPFGMSAANNRVYASLFNTNEVAVIDATTDTLLSTYTTGGHPCLIGAFDDRAYVANHSHFYSLYSTQLASATPKEAEALAAEYVRQNPEDTGVTVVRNDGTTERVLVGEIGFFGAAVDPTRNLVYVTRRDLGREGLFVLDGTDHHLIRHVPLSKPYSVAVNPNTNHVFVVMGQPEVSQVYVFDGDQDYALIRIEDVLLQSQYDGMMNGGQGVGVMNDWVYVANYGDHSMTSIPDAPGTPPEYDPPIAAPFVRTWLNDTRQPGHRPAGLPVGYFEPRPFMKQDFENGFPGGVTEDVLFLHDVMTGTDQIYEFKVFIEPGAPSAQTLMLNTSDEVSVAWNSVQDVKVAENSTSDRLRFGNYLAPGNEPSYFRTYLRFPLGAIPAGSTIDSAVLQMWVFDERYPGGGSLNAGAYQVLQSWSEAGLSNTTTWTWGSLPSFQASPVSANVISTLDQWYYWDVTALVQGWVNGSTPNNGLMVSGNPESSPLVTQAMGARSRAGAFPNLGPVLMVQFTPPSGPVSLISPGYDGTHGHWLRFPWAWDPSMPEYACAHVEPGVYFDYGVRRGFGMVWCTLHYSPNPAYALYQLGKPLEWEEYGSGATQRFQNGIMFWIPDADYPSLSGSIVVAYSDGWWHKYPY